MLTYLFPITQKSENLEQLVKDASEATPCKIIFLCEKKNLEMLKKIKKANAIIFPNGTSEDSMIKEAVCSLDDCQLVIKRSYFQATQHNFMALKFKAEDGNDVVIINQNKQVNKFKKYFINLFDNLCETILGFTFYKGNLGLIYLDELAHRIFKDSPENNLLKINNWFGIKIAYAEDNIITNKTPFVAKKEIVKVSVFGFLLISCIASACVFPNFVFQNLISFLLWLLVLLFFGLISIYQSLLLYTKVKAGNLKVESARKIDVMGEI